MQGLLIQKRSYVFLRKARKAFCALLCVFCAVSFAQAEDVVRSDQANFRLIEIASGLEHPWGLTFLPNSDILVTEREGRLRIVRNGELDPNPLTGIPENIYVAGQGGMLDVAVHPEFETNRLVYLSYAGLGEGGAGTEVMRGRLDGNNLEEAEVIFTVEPKTRGRLHYGSRLVFATDGTLLITIGDRYNRMHDAQDPDNHLGTTIRINDDGSVPENNPFIDHPSYQPEVFSYGHRNAQGLAIRPSDNSIWAHEHGPRGGDEVNKLEAGKNYGWPAITYGIDYSGAIISDQTHAEGMEQPVIYWDPSIAPSGMTFYDGAAFPEWQGDLFVGALVQRHLRRLEMNGDQVIAQEVLLDGMARIRDVRNGPDGSLYILTDDLNGKILRLESVN